MTLQEQITFLDELETRFLYLDKQYRNDLKYDGHYGDMASKVGEVMDSIWRLQGLEK